MVRHNECKGIGKIAQTIRRTGCRDANGSFHRKPLLMTMGLDQFLARAIAKFAVREGIRVAAESKVCRQVAKDIRLLAKRPRRQATIVRCAKRLYDAWDGNRMIGDLLLYQANIDDFEFMKLVKSVAEGQRTDISRVLEIAAEAAPRLALKPGPKISIASAAHEFFLADRLGIIRQPWPKANANRDAKYADAAAEYVDALTLATRKEFDNPTFDSRPARRRTCCK